MKRLLSISLMLLSATAAFAMRPLDGRAIDIRETDNHGNPTFVAGNLGKLLGPGTVENTSRAFLRARTDLLPIDGSQDFEATATYTDDLGQTHVRLQERVNGMPIVGAEYIVHADREGNVRAMNGRLAPSTRELARTPEVDAWTAIENAVAQRGIENGKYLGRPALSYVMNEKGNTFLAWSIRVEYVNEQGPQIDVIYADALTADLAFVAPEYKYAKNRNTYTANNGTSLPGTLKRTEGSANIGDAALDAAHNYAGNVYDYYKNVHNRDSYDNAGATLKASVHFSTNYNNAYWNGSQMVYGDGDGSQFIALSRDLDVDAHELTHAVTERTANLVYSNESGALNEATSDILGNSCEAYTENGGTPNSNTWKVGEDIYTPGTAGDALRFMNDPAAGGDYDYYPTRYTGSADNGGVHSNSGIANLAYYLMVMGGTHPRGKTTVNVTPLSTNSATSLDMGQKIWYRALTVYWTSTTGFSGARTGTVNAATDLYGAAAAATVTAAWDAVGAPGGSTGGTTTTLTNGVAVTGIGASTGSWKHYKIAVPSGQTSLAIVMSGGTGDGDMYVKRGAQPTSSSYDYRPYLNGNNETVNVTNPVAGDWYISIYAYSTFSSVSLKATYSTTGGSTCTSVSGTLSGTGTSYYTTQYTSSVSGAHTGKLTGPASGADFDLYLQKLSGTTWSNVAAGESSTASENVSYNGTSGTYRWRVYSYSGSGSFTLCTTKP